MLRWRSGAPMALVMAGLVACSDDPTGAAPMVVDRVEVAPGDRVLVVGDTAHVSAVPRSADGRVVGAPVSWRSLNAAVATVRADAAGAVIVAAAQGTVRVEAEAGGKVGSVTIRVASPPVVAEVVIVPSALVLAIGQQVPFRAVAKTADGEVIEGRTATWSVLGTAAAITIDPATGLATLSTQAHGAGVVRATIDGIQGEASLRVVETPPPPPAVASVTIEPSNLVLPVGHEVVLQAIVKSATGELITGREVTWTVNQGAVATVTPTGVPGFAKLATLAPSTTVIWASVDGITGQTTLYVTATTPPPEAVRYLTFLPAHQGAWVNQVVPFGASLIAVGATGRVPTPVVTWSVQDPAIAEVDENGNVRGLSAGTTRVYARSGSIQGVAQITVFTSPGDSAIYELTNDWWDGMWHLLPQVGTEVWTDEQGEEHDLALWLLGGTLMLTNDGHYERVLRIGGWVTLNGAAQKVIERDVIDAGTASIMVGGETGYWLQSTTTPGYRYEVVSAGAGRVLMRAAIGIAPALEYMFRLRE